MSTREERFTDAWWERWSMPEPNTGCHLWLGAMCRLGYGRLWWNGRGGNPAHRVSYATRVGQIAPGLKVCHRCDNPSCVNPDHLFLGTQKDNLRDMFRKGRARPRGIPFKAPLPRRTVAVSGAVGKCLSRCDSTSYENLGDDDALSP